MPWFLFSLFRQRRLCVSLFSPFLHCYGAKDSYDKVQNIRALIVHISYSFSDPNPTALVILRIQPHRPRILILLLSAPTPRRRLVLALFLGLIALLLRLVHARRSMLSRRVYRQQLERLVALRDELVLGTRGHDDDVAGLDFLVAALDGGEAAAGGEEEDLVDGVDLKWTLEWRVQERVEVKPRTRSLYFRYIAQQHRK